MRRTSPIAALLFLVVAASNGSALASVRVSDATVVVGTRAGQRALITRSPFRLAFEDSHGRRVLSEIGGANGSTLVEPPAPQIEFGSQTPSPPSLYAPLAFVVGTHAITQTPGGQWQGTLQSVTQGGTAYSAGRVISARHAGGGVRLVVSTSDPTGRKLVVGVRPSGGDAISVTARPTPAKGVVAVSDSFGSNPGEAFHGFGGRHDGIDQHGADFFSFLEQENVSSGSASGLAALAPGSADSFMFPNGPSAAYYVQSSFLSSDGYGFLLDRDQISHWRLDSDRDSAWQTEAAAPSIRYLVAPGGP